MIQQRIVSYPDIEQANNALGSFLEKGWRAISVATVNAEDYSGRKMIQITFLIEMEGEKCQKKMPKNGAYLT